MNFFFIDETEQLKSRWNFAETLKFFLASSEILKPHKDVILIRGTLFKTI